MLVGDDIANIASLINCKDFSSKEQLIRVTAYVLRSVKHYSSRCITPEELHQAESYWLSKESQSLMSGKPVFKSNSLAYFVTNKECGDVEVDSAMRTFRSKRSIQCFWILNIT